MTIETTTCPDCEGFGYLDEEDDDAEPEECPTCHGDGTVAVDENGEMVEDEPI